MTPLGALSASEIYSLHGPDYFGFNRNGNGLDEFPHKRVELSGHVKEKNGIWFL
jgi:hypothetical protein